MAFTELSGQRATFRDGPVSASTPTAFAGSVTAGNLLVCGGACWQTGAGNSSFAVSGSLSSTWAVIFGATGTTFAGGVGRPFIAYKVAPSSGTDTVTITPNGSGNYLDAAIAEFTSTTATLSVNGGESTGDGSDFTAQDGITTLTANELVLRVLAYGSAGQTITPNQGTQIDEDETAARMPYNFGFDIKATAGLYTATWTLGAALSWSVITASFTEGVAETGPFMRYRKTS